MAKLCSVNEREPRMFVLFGQCVCYDPLICQFIS